MSTAKPMSLESKSSNHLTSEEQHRIELLKKERDVERQEKERAIWREASKPIRTYGTEEWDPPAQAKVPDLKPNKGESGFFAKLRLGRFLG